MSLKVLLPSQVFAEMTDVSRIVAETREGLFGLLPRRLDCVAALSPGILTYETRADGEIFVAVDEGVLVKTGFQVTVSVRNAVSGTDLSLLRKKMEQEYLHVNEKKREVRSTLKKMESAFLHRFMKYLHD